MEPSESLPPVPRVERPELAESRRESPSEEALGDDEPDEATEPLRHPRATPAAAWFPPPAAPAAASVAAPAGEGGEGDEAEQVAGNGGE